MFTGVPPPSLSFPSSAATTTAPPSNCQSLTRSVTTRGSVLLWRCLSTERFLHRRPLVAACQRPSTIPVHGFDAVEMIKSANFAQSLTGNLTDGLKVCVCVGVCCRWIRCVLKGSSLILFRNSVNVTELRSGCGLVVTVVPRPQQEQQYGFDLVARPGIAESLRPPEPTILHYERCCYENPN